jgi:hypothetical protein
VALAPDARLRLPDGRGTRVREIADTVFCRSVPGYMRIAFETNGPARLAVVATPAPGRTETIFAVPLD